MGKNRYIKIMGNLLAGVVAHKILEKYTNKKESLNHLRHEIDNYRDNLSYFVEEFNWNAEDIRKIKNESLREIENELKKKHFEGVKFPSSEKESFLEEVMKEVFEN